MSKSPEERVHTPQEAEPVAVRNQHNEPEQPHDADDDAPSSLFSFANLKVAQVNMVAGTLNGYSIGFVGVYSTLYGISTDCSLFKQPVSCNTLSNSNCLWQSNIDGGLCTWDNKALCNLDYTDVSSCEANKDCNWVYSDNECRNISGYSSLYSGIFAGAMIVGCMVGSIFAGMITKRLGPKISFLIVGLVGVISSVLYHVSAAVDQFWILCAARLLIGCVLGLVCVAAPMYVAENAHPKYAKMIGVFFQVFTTLGIFLAATVGLGVGQSVSYNKNSNQHLMGRMQALCAFSTFFSLLAVLLGVFLGGCISGEDFKYAERMAEQEKQDAEEGKEREEQYTIGQMMGPLLVGVVLAGTIQLTGINAVMNYAPTIMGNLGLAPLVGNFVVMTWNFVTTIASIPLASVFTMRQLFLFGSIVTSVCCLFLCGIPVYPGVSNDNVRNGVAITGILLFIAAFEIGVGPCFYVLCQDLFPHSFRPKGSSFTMMAQFVFNVIINVFYPIATKNISGGASGDQNKGQAIAFIFFGCIGTVCFIIQVFFMYPWEDKNEAPRAVEPSNEEAKQVEPRVGDAISGGSEES